MATARYENFGELLEPGLRKIFYETYKQIPSVLPQLFNMSSTTKAVIHDLTVGTMGAFPAFTGTINYDRMYQGYKSTYEFPEFADGFQIERKLFDDDQYNVINKRPVGLAIAGARRREQDGADVFNNSFSATYAGPDAVALCSATHPTTAPDGPAARSNLGTNTFSHAGVTASRLAMRNTTDDRGGKILVRPTHVLIHPAKEELAYELFRSPGKIDTGDNNLNFYRGTMDYIVWDYLDSEENWWMIDLPLLKMNLNWFDRVALEFFFERDFDTLVAKFAAYMRYGAGWSDWVGIYGNQVE